MDDCYYGLVTSEQLRHHDIDVKRWVQEKRPDWLDDADVRKSFAGVVF